MFRTTALLAVVFAAFASPALAVPATSSSTTQAPAPSVSVNPNPYYNRPFGTIGFNQEWANSILHDPNYNSNVPTYYTAADQSTFNWVNQYSDISALGDLFNFTQSNGWLFQMVIYDLPNRFCGSVAQPGEFSYANGGASQYQNFIHTIVSLLQAFPTAPVVVILEPNSLSQLMTVPLPNACQGLGGPTGPYMTSLLYALQSLTAATPNVHVYVDAGNAATISTAAQRSGLASLINTLYTGLPAANRAAFRGLATNVAGYNAFSASPAEPIFSGNPVFNEVLYTQALAPLLTQPPHFIVDTSRAGHQGIRASLSDWCNVQYAGFGALPTNTTQSSIIDAIVWVKPAGYSDGSTTSPNLDPACLRATSYQPAPVFNGWMSTYFNDLVGNASPQL